MKIDEFLKLLEARQLVSERVIKQVREKIAKGDRKITSKSLLKYLVKKELITRTQAKQLLETSLTVTAAAESSILGMQAITPEQQLKKDKKESAAEEVPTLSPLDTPLAEIESAVREGLSSLDEDEGAREELSEKDVRKDARTSRRKLKGKTKKGQKKNEFDTPLLLFGGGGLIALILAGVIIGFLLTREDADAILAEAGGFFESESYTQAIKQYERFLEGHSGHPDASKAKVKLGLARIWKATSGTSQFSIALNTTKEVLDRIEDEKDFEDAKKDLSVLLPKIAQGLAAQAEKESDPDKIVSLVTESKEALALCNNTKFIPTSFRDDVVIAGIDQTLDRVERDQEQRGKLGDALEAIQKQIDAANTAEAYAIHKQLLQDYPGLLSDESLAAKVREISAAEQTVVSFTEEQKAAQTDEHPSPFLAELALAARSGPASGASGVAAVRTAGAVFALDVNDGRLLWRKHVGHGAGLPVVTLDDGDFIIVDAVRHELVRLSAADGKLVWRQSFDGPIAPPAVVASRLLVTEKGGKLHVVDARSGERNGYVTFGQPLPVPPAVNKLGTRAYVIGQHSSLFTISLEDYSCLGVSFVGHERGSIAASPVVALGKVIVAENAGRDTSRLRVFSTDDMGAVTEQDTSRRLKGLVNTPLLVDGRRLVALTSRGQVTAYEVGSGSGKEVLTRIASRGAESGSAVARFGLVQGSHVWSAGDRLNKFEVLATGNRLPVAHIEFDYVGDTFDYPLQIVDELVIHLRHSKNHAGSIVSAMKADTGSALWETQLGVPLAGAPVVDQQGPTISAVTASGAAYTLDRQAMKARVQDQASQLPQSVKLPALSDRADLGGGRLALSSKGEKTILHYSPEGALTEIELPSPIACPVTAWGNAFVAPTKVGQVYLYDSETGEQLGTPFQPQLDVSSSFAWLTPAVYDGSENSQLVVSDGKNMVYLLEQSGSPQPSLGAAAEAAVGGAPLRTRLAVLGDTVYAGTQTRELVRYALPSLEAQEAIGISGKIVWGPFNVGDQLLLTTGSGEMVCVERDEGVIWSQPLSHGQPQGEPLANAQGVYVTWQQGGLSRINPLDGSQSELMQLPQPAVTGPVAFGNRLLLASPDGALLILNQP